MKINNIDAFSSNQISIFDTNGTLVYTKKDYKGDWAFNRNDETQVAAGNYYYELVLYSDDENQNQTIYNGMFYLKF